MRHFQEQTVTYFIDNFKKVVELLQNNGSSEKGRLITCAPGLPQVAIFRQNGDFERLDEEYLRAVLG